MAYVKYVGDTRKTFKWESEGTSYKFTLDYGDVVYVADNQLRYLVSYGNFFELLESAPDGVVNLEADGDVLAAGTSVVDEIIVAFDGTAHKIKSSGTTIASVLATAQAAAVASDIVSTDVRSIVKITQAAYTSLNPKVATTLYLIVG